VLGLPVWPLAAAAARVETRLSYIVFDWEMGPTQFVV